MHPASPARSAARPVQPPAGGSRQAGCESDCRHGSRRCVPAAAAAAAPAPAAPPPPALRLPLSPVPARLAHHSSTACTAAARFPAPQAASAPGLTSTSLCRPAAAAASTAASTTRSAAWLSRGQSPRWPRSLAWRWAAAASWRWRATRACARRVRCEAGGAGLGAGQGRATPCRISSGGQLHTLLAPPPLHPRRHIVWPSGAAAGHRPRLWRHAAPAARRGAEEGCGDDADEVGVV